MHQWEFLRIILWPSFEINSPAITLRWRLAICPCFNIISTKNINNVNSAKIFAYVSSRAELDASYNRTVQLRRICKGIYNSLEELLEENCESLK